MRTWNWKWHRRRAQHRAAPRVGHRLETLETRLLLAADLWQQVAEMPKARGDTISYLNAASFEAYELNHASLETVLNNVPDEFTPAIESRPQITLPTPAGGLASFHFAESPIMEPGLAEEFPEIRTFAGQGIDDPLATLRFDITPAGFHAQVLTPRGDYFIDPYFHLDNSLYASYSRDSLAAPPDFEEFQIDLNYLDQDGPVARSASSAPSVNTPAPNEDAARSGTQLRTYRTAIAATGEYTQFHGGTVALGQAAIVTAINRVTGIFETELAIRLSLVANNDQIVYTDPNSDPYSGDVNASQLTVNDNNIDAEIGVANYDIGHYFTQGGGGLAQLGSVGGPNKGRGGTGLSEPTGDPFYVDFVAHEIGHQFNAFHTWNGDSDNCTAGAHSPASAMEPGSGSTIMAYAGICGNDNLQSISDPYFHSISFDEIINFVDNIIPAVGTRTATGNQVPVVSAGADFTIPASTPFQLTASGSDPDSHPLTFHWEQRDVGPRQDVNAGDNGQSPLFRSFSPTPDPTRTLPRLSDLVNNTTVIGETLPTTTRTLNFRVTARDNQSGGGAVNSDDMVINVQNTGTPFVVTAPNTAVSWTGMTTQTVTWNVASTTAAPISTANVNILLSTDGGLTYPTMILANTPNDGSQSITVPNIETTTARVRVEGADNIFFDISDTNFTINSVAADRIAVIREGQNFHLDSTGNGAWDTVSGGDTFSVFGIPELVGLATGVVGDWDGDNDDELGLYHNGFFYLDTTDNGKWDTVAGGDTFYDFNLAVIRSTATPVIGDWDGNGIDDLGLYNDGFFYLDTNGNGMWDTVAGGDTFRDFGITVIRSTARPVIGDWDANGSDDLGLFNDNHFYLDTTGNGTWDTVAGGDKVHFFGLGSIRGTALPIIGDWNNDGIDDLGLFNNDRDFFLDTNLSGRWNGVSGGDTYYFFNYGFGGLPLIGNWGLPGGVLRPAGAARSSDVNRDGTTTPLDALLIINALREHGTQTVGEAADAVMDVNQDGYVAPLDALLVINDSPEVAQPVATIPPRTSPPITSRLPTLAEPSGSPAIVIGESATPFRKHPLARTIRTARVLDFPELDQLLVGEEDLDLLAADVGSQ